MQEILKMQGNAENSIKLTQQTSDCIEECYLHEMCQPQEASLYDELIMINGYVNVEDTIFMYGFRYVLSWLMLWLPVVELSKGEVGGWARCFISLVYIFIK